jgi:hypothetical protein
MKFRPLYLFIYLLTATLALGQGTSDMFEKFAIRQDSLFIVAYEQKDVNAYHKLLTDFLSQYDKLSTNEKKNFSRYLTGAYYNFSCTYSLLDNKQMALTYLKKSIDAGYMNYQHIQEDSDLDNIRKEKEFLDLNNYLRSIGDYLYILKKADQYNANDSRLLPIFSYQSSDNPNLMALRKALNLDSIAGKGSDVLKILNLLHWMHSLIPHDGNHNNPVVKNAMSMIAECKRDNRGLNCRGLATVLNECYLSLGIKSRIVTCLPKDSLKMDNDCHVINSVYSETLKKWLWIDPTFNAYVLNENGELLSIEEVRTRIIQNKPLIINPDANWNNRNLQTKEYYLLNYMAKNLYILECPVVSEYNMETLESGRVFNYIQLLPLDYFKQSPDKSENKDEKTNTSWIKIKTNNDKLFWTTP